MDRLECGVLACGPQGMLYHANTAARRELATASRLRLVSGRVRGNPDRPLHGIRPLGSAGPEQLSFLTHERSRSWNEAQMGEILNIYIDTIPDDEYQRRQQQMRELSSNLAGLFAGASDEKRG